MKTRPWLGVLGFFAALGCLGLAAESAWADSPGDVPAKTYVEAPQGSLSLSGSVYFFGYEPDLQGAENSFDLYAFILNLDGAAPDGRTGIHAQLRFRDTKLRPFFNSNVWAQELYVYRKTPFGDAHVGKFYRKVGLLWDDSFFGNVQYFNGLKLNPNYGVEWVGTRPLGPSFSVDYSAQFFPNNDGTNGALNGRDVDSDPFAKMRNTATVRIAPAWNFGDKESLSVGLSALNARLKRSTTTAGSFNINQVAGDVTLTIGPSTSYVEILHQNGERDDAAHPLGRPGYDSADYLLAGTRYQLCDGVNARFNYSSADYAGQNAREEEFLPGLVFTFPRRAKGLSVIVEFDYWRTLPHGGGPQSLIDRSYNTVLNYAF